MSSNTLLLNIKLNKKLHTSIYLAKKIICLIILCTQISICSELQKQQQIHDDAGQTSFFQQINNTIKTKISSFVDTIKDLFATKNYAIIEYPNTRYDGRVEDRN